VGFLGGFSGFFGWVFYCQPWCKDVDIVITTALIPGKKAPILIKKYMIGMSDNFYIQFSQRAIAEIKQLCLPCEKLNFLLWRSKESFAVFMCRDITEPVLWIRDILVRIQIRGSGSCYSQQKISLKVFLLITFEGTFTSLIKNIRNQVFSYNFA
jgi:hypothetical protein